MEGNVLEAKCQERTTLSPLIPCGYCFFNIQHTHLVCRSSNFNLINSH